MILPTQERKIEIESETIGWIGHKERKVDETSSLMSTRDEKRERERDRQFFYVWWFDGFFITILLHN